MKKVRRKRIPLTNYENQGGMLKESKDTLKITSGPITRRKDEDMTHPLHAFVTSYFLEEGAKICHRAIRMSHG